MMLKDNVKRIALVTGASRGIGAATAIRLGAEGYTVCVNYVSNVEAAESVVRSIVDAGGDAFCVQADVSKEAEVFALFAAIDRMAFPLAALVNNAGVLFTQSKLVDITADRIEKVLAANVTGSLLCAREAVKRMSTEFNGQGGVIVNVSSAASRTGSPNEYIDYAASKGAVDAFTLGLSKEVAAEGIRVNGVRPGLIYTDIHADGGEPNRVDRLASRIPMQRGGTSEEVAASICFLLSDDASFITGSIIDVTGGL
ncbi:SDR family oxidoreductase [Enterovibrio baiacu]|uniref:SDR family oxidoreductase n=1 Tax=Enterovibrio baiacu TaxID=2491023 RepID=UPI00101088D4|nr:SDR family oxidoreductase [Enterovibrio baiacu]MBE1275379.1 SDR family oxidoreductase [Enterovibrio baiacu]